MVVALTALVVALGGVALAADGLVGPDGQVQGCVARQNIVNPVTDSVLPSLTQVVTPKGALIVVPAGSSCPSQTDPVSLSSSGLPQVFASHRAAEHVLDKTNSTIAAAKLPAGDYLVNATAVVTDPGSTGVEQTVTCVLLGPDGKAIPGSASSATIPADTPDSRLTIPITAIARDLPAGALALDCKSSLPIAGAAESTGARAAAVKRPPPCSKCVNEAQCRATGGSVDMPPPGLEDPFSQGEFICTSGPFKGFRVEHMPDREVPGAKPAKAAVNPTQCRRQGGEVKLVRGGGHVCRGGSFDDYDVKQGTPDRKVQSASDQSPPPTTHGTLQATKANGM